MKNDVFFMATTLLNVWKQDVPSDYFACTIVSETAEEYSTLVFENDTDIYQIIFETFETDVLAQNASIYITHIPHEQFVNACVAKNVSSINYLNDAEEEMPTNTKIKINKFANTFGRIIDFLSVYKPARKSINML